MKINSIRKLVFHDAIKAMTGPHSGMTLKEAFDYARENSKGRPTEKTDIEILNELEVGMSKEEG